MKNLLILCILISNFSFGQDCLNNLLFIRFKNDIQTELFRNQNRVVWDDETRISYYKLMIDCPVECLVKYIEDSIPSIRAIIFVGLAQKNVDQSILEEIFIKHKNDTAYYIDSPTDVVITWTVIGFMQTILKLKADKEIPNSSGNFEFLHENLQKTIREKIRINIPGEYHGKISKEDILLIQSLTCTIDGVRVISFKLTIDNETFETNNIFSENIRKAIRNMKVGNRLYIEDITVEFPEKEFRKLPSIMLEIK